MTEFLVLARKTVMGKKSPTITDALKAAIKESGQSRYEISKATGILQTSLSRFVRGETSLRLDKADKLAQYLGLWLVSDPNALPSKPKPESLARPTSARRRKGLNPR